MVILLVHIYKRKPVVGWMDLSWIKDLMQKENHEHVDLHLACATNLGMKVNLLIPAHFSFFFRLFYFIFPFSFVISDLLMQQTLKTYGVVPLTVLEAAVANKSLLGSRKKKEI